MRTYHRWLSVIFGIFLLWISATGVLSQIGSLVNQGGFENETAERGKAQAAAIENAVVPPARAHEEEEEAAKAVAAASSAAKQAVDSGQIVVTSAPAKFVCPADMTCRPKRMAKPGDWNVGLLHHLHSGESFGPLGVVISIMSGLSLLFFAFSGLWMYVSMWRNRASRSLKPGWFWN